VSFRELKAQIYWPTTDQKVRGSNPCGRTYLASKYCFETVRARIGFAFAQEIP
jgi:hypothetical protein